MTTRPHSSFKIVFILGLLAMLMPLSIDMYLPALPVISAQFGVPAGSTQMTLSTYILGFALGQLIYGPMADSFGRKPVILGGTLIFAAAAVACALAQSIDQLITMRFFHGLAAAAASVRRRSGTRVGSAVCIQTLGRMVRCGNRGGYRSPGRLPSGYRKGP